MVGELQQIRLPSQMANTGSVQPHLGNDGIQAIQFQISAFELLRQIKLLG